MGCEREIAQKIVDKKADFVLALKGDQGTLQEDVKLFIEGQQANGFSDSKICRDTTVDGDYGHNRNAKRRPSFTKSIGCGTGTTGPA